MIADMEKLKIELIAERKKAITYQKTLDDLAYKIRNHNYNTCTCQVYLIPEVAEALKHVRVFQLHEKVITDVDNIRKKNTALRNELER